jgi:hypothetical protein
MINLLSSQLSLVSNLSTAIPQLDVKDPSACKIFFQNFLMMERKELFWNNVNNMYCILE